jgi:hypothetical protein
MNSFCSIQGSINISIEIETRIIELLNSDLPRVGVH